MSDFIERRANGMSHEELSEAVFDGRVVCFEQLSPVQALIAEARCIVTASFDDPEPLTAHQRLSQSAYETCYAAARREFQQNAKVARGMEAALAAAGLEISRCYRDRFVLRVSPPEAQYYQRGFGAIPPHRDSWGSGISSQINWWMPVYPLTADNTMAIFPAHWTKPIENDSDGWDWTRAGKDPEVPLLPTAKGMPDRSGEIRLDIEPGTLVAFSGAHLHASVPNTTAYARFSCETRTVSVRDLAVNRGAPSIDGADVPPAYAWFRRFGDGELLRPPDISEKPTIAR